MVHEFSEHQTLHMNINTLPVPADAHKQWPIGTVQNVNETYLFILAKANPNFSNHMPVKIFQKLYQRYVSGMSNTAAANE